MDANLKNTPSLARVLPDGRYLLVAPLPSGAARLQVFPHDLPWFADDEWDYPHHLAAIAAAAEWDGQGEPRGWIRHPATGRTGR